MASVGKVLPAMVGHDVSLVVWGALAVDSVADGTSAHQLPDLVTGHRGHVRLKAKVGAGELVLRSVSNSHFHVGQGPGVTYKKDDVKSLLKQ